MINRLNKFVSASYKFFRQPFFHTRCTRFCCDKLRMLVLIVVLLFPQASPISPNVLGSFSVYNYANNLASKGDKLTRSFVFANLLMNRYVIFSMYCITMKSSYTLLY